MSCIVMSSHAVSCQLIRMYVCNACMCVCACMYVCACLYVMPGCMCMYFGLYACMHVCTHARTYVCMFACM